MIGDPLRLRQVLTNLIGNAIKFTERGHVRLHVEGATPSAALATATSAVIAFRVSDTGPGIADDKRASITEAYTQADASTAREFGGSGLGLNITTHLLELMGSTLRIDSLVGEGSTFSFELSLGLPPLPHGGHVARYRALPGERVLWVEASGQSVPWHRQLFGLWSVTMDTARDLDEAQRLLMQHRYRAAFVEAKIVWAASDTAAQALCGSLDGARLCLRCAATDTLPSWLERAGVPFDVLMSPISPQDLHRALTGEVHPGHAMDPKTRLDGLRLLVADDNEVNLLVATATLEGLGARVSAARDGLDVLRQIDEQDFDAVLMDLQMPRMDGFEATRLLRERERSRGTLRLPVIALSAIDGGDAARIRAAGFDVYVGKPFRIARLVRELRAALVRKVPSTELSASDPVDSTSAASRG